MYRMIYQLTPQPRRLLNQWVLKGPCYDCLNRCLHLCLFGVVLLASHQPIPPGGFECKAP